MYDEGIDDGINKGYRNEVISRKIYLTYPTFAFDGNYDLEFELLNSVSNFFSIPLTSVQIAGSAKTGYSYYKNRAFEKGRSDLDIAIIDSSLYKRYCEIVMRHTNGFKDLTDFARSEESNNFVSYKYYLAKGIFRPDLMPSCDDKRKWFNFFNKLSVKYIDIFADVNAGIYFSETFFEYKQAENIDFFKRTQL